MRAILEELLYSVSQCHTTSMAAPDEIRHWVPRPSWRNPGIPLPDDLAMSHATTAPDESSYCNPSTDSGHSVWQSHMTRSYSLIAQTTDCLWLPIAVTEHVWSQAYGVTWLMCQIVVMGAATLSRWPSIGRLVGSCPGGVALTWDDFWCRCHIIILSILCIGLQCIHNSFINLPHTYCSIYWIHVASWMLHVIEDDLSV